MSISANFIEVKGVFMQSHQFMKYAFQDSDPARRGGGQPDDPRPRRAFDAQRKLRQMYHDCQILVE
jgi:hypothetical protein